jgi:hypothetical protein
VKKILNRLFGPPPARTPLTAEQLNAVAEGMRVFADDLDAGHPMAVALINGGEPPWEDAEAARRAGHVAWADWPTSSWRHDTDD